MAGSVCDTVSKYFSWKDIQQSNDVPSPYWYLNPDILFGSHLCYIHALNCKINHTVCMYLINRRELNDFHIKMETKTAVRMLYVSFQFLIDNYAVVTNMD